MDPQTIFYKVDESDNPVVLNFDIQGGATAGSSLSLSGIPLGSFPHDFEEEIGNNKDLFIKQLTLLSEMSDPIGGRRQISVFLKLLGGVEPYEDTIEFDSEELPSSLMITFMFVR